MKEIRNVNVSFGKNGNGFTTTRITLPVPWIRKMGFTENNKEAIIEFDGKQIIIKNKEEKVMKRIDRDFDYENRKGEKIWCVEAVSNDNNEYSIDIYECDSEETAIAECEKMNRTNQDKNLKFITIEYTVTEDSLESM